MISYVYPGHLEDIRIGGSYHLMGSDGRFVHVVVQEKERGTLLGHAMFTGFLVESIDGGYFWSHVPDWRGCFDTCLST